MMKRLLALTMMFSIALAVSAKDFAWICAIEWSEENPEWVFVYEDIKRQQSGSFRAFIKWEFTDDPNKSMAMQTWLISPDFDKIKVVKSVGYGKDGNVVYSKDERCGENWTFVLPETYSEAVVDTIKEILLNK